MLNTAQARHSGRVTQGDPFGEECVDVFHEPTRLKRSETKSLRRRCVRCRPLFAGAMRDPPVLFRRESSIVSQRAASELGG